MASEKITNILEEIKSLTILELNDLVKAVEEEFGVSAAAPVGVVAAAGAAAEEKTEFDVELTEIGPNKVKVIKIVRDYTGLGLKEAKDLVDGAPVVIKEGLPKAEAEAIVEAIAAAGGSAERCSGRDPGEQGRSSYRGSADHDRRYL